MSLGVTQESESCSADRDNGSANPTIVDTPKILFHGNTLCLSETDDLHAQLASTYPASATSSCDCAPTAASGRPCPCHSVWGSADGGGRRPPSPPPTARCWRARGTGRSSWGCRRVAPAASPQRRCRWSSCRRREEPSRQEMRQPPNAAKRIVARHAPRSGCCPWQRRTIRGAREPCGGVRSRSDRYTEGPSIEPYLV